MIDTRVVKDCSGTIDLCGTFCYDWTVDVPVEEGKVLSYIEPKEGSEGKFIAYFTDETNIEFSSAHTVSFGEIIDNTLIVYTTDKALRQVETQTLYDNCVIDVIEGYNDGKPYARYTYIEVAIPHEDFEDSSGEIE